MQKDKEKEGGHSEGDTPLPIPNRVVKPFSANGTGSKDRESRSPPLPYYIKAPFLHRKGAFFFKKYYLRTQLSPPCSNPP